MVDDLHSGWGMPNALATASGVRPEFVCGASPFAPADAVGVSPVRNFDDADSAICRTSLLRLCRSCIHSTAAPSFLCRRRR
jgi:hypothetical protein